MVRELDVATADLGVEKVFVEVFTYSIHK